MGYPALSRSINKSVFIELLSMASYNPTILESPTQPAQIPPKVPPRIPPKAPRHEQAIRQNLRNRQAEYVGEGQAAWRRRRTVSPHQPSWHKNVGNRVR